MGEEKPIAYFSRNLQPRESRYASVENGCLKHFAVYLVGQQFTIVTDHRALQYPAKTNLQDHARLCKNLACKTCLARARNMPLFLHNSCTILHISCNKWCKILQELLQEELPAFLAHFLQDLARIGARLCKNHARKGTYRVHVPSKSCMQDSCKILAQSCMILQVRFCWVPTCRTPTQDSPGGH